MNPHDPRERPGAYRVAEMFGVDDPWELSDNHPVGSALDLIGRTVAESARDVDELHSALAQAPRSAIEALTPIARDDIAGLGEQGSPCTPPVQTSDSPRPTGQRLRPTDPSPVQLPASPNSRSARSPFRSSGITRTSRWQSSHGRGTTTGPSPAIVSDGLWKPSRPVGCASTGVRSGPTTSGLPTAAADALEPEVWPETVRRLVADGLLDQDTNEALYRPGQLLSLTAEGETALREARPRLRACPPPCTAATPAPFPAARPALPRLRRPAAKPSRTR